MAGGGVEGCSRTALSGPSHALHACFIVSICVSCVRVCFWDWSIRARRASRKVLEGHSPSPQGEPSLFVEPVPV